MRIARQFRQGALGIILSGFLFGPLLHASPPNGTFLLMSREGGGEWQNTSAQWHSLPRLLHIDPLVDTAWRTAANQSLLLGLSNRSVLVLAPESVFRVTRFTQQAFVNTAPQPTLEPSGSELHIRHEGGRMLFKSGELRANSSVVIRSNHGELRIGSGTTLIETTAGATRIWMIDGSATFTPTEGERVFLTHGISYHYHTERAPLRFNFTDGEVEEDIRQLHNAAVRGFNRLAIVAPGEAGLSRAERRHPNLPRPRIVQSAE